MAPILILDGGLGTSLQQKYGVEFSSSKTPLWSTDLLVSDPKTLLACQSDFGDVPVDVLLTATYQVSIHGFKNTKSEDHPHGVGKHEISRYLATAVDVAKQAGSAQVALSIGPYGACMIPSQEYSGQYDAEHESMEALEEWHRERFELFAEVDDINSRVGYVALETVPRLDEIRAMRRAAHSDPVFSNVPHWVSCLYPGEGETLPDGASAGDAVRAMMDPTDGPLPWGIGINCTKVWKLKGIVEVYGSVIRELIGQGKLDEWPALVLYPDGTNGEVYNTETQTWEVPSGIETGGRESWEEQLKSVVRDAIAGGEWRCVVVGGCCMASAEDIQRLRAVLLSEGP
ncbi:homocysteine S-methyltransferase [Emericellopsis cladophorae]|uniref:Homocysteine S-methyltransferase n=1 Tax=Emericellopsis cladophorae TaxID=2686198 RepID=A0A9P9Y2H5_9HYPO|nr:homocysteine S-methyltransferase [Emericellopsis cladophorae]KAI6781943.1 homocysteine S-methyltransferase [Emericellopsis cladophorae]